MTCRSARYTARSTNRETTRALEDISNISTSLTTERHAKDFKTVSLKENQGVSFKFHINIIKFDKVITVNWL